MDFDRDKSKNETEGRSGETRGRREFDFSAFLEPESLDDKITDVMDGKDLLEPDAFGDFAPDYIPRRPGDGEHGRHEAPAPEGAEQEEPEPEPEIDPNDPRYAAPERPRVVVAEPRPRVYVTPPGSEDYEEPARARRRGGKKWVAAAVIVLAVIAVVLFVVISGLSSLSDDDAEATPSPTSPLSLGITESTASTPASVSTPASASTQAPATPQTVTHSITVTAGSGGSVSPSGAVSVEDGGSVTFTITPDSGYVISQLLVDGTPVSVSGSYTFSSVTSNHTIYAVFQKAATDTPAPTAEPTVPPTPDPTEPPPVVEEPPAAEPEQGGQEDTGAAEPQQEQEGE